MAKKTASTTEPDAGEIPIRCGKAAQSDRDRVNVIGNGNRLRLIVYPSEPLLAHMHDWSYVGASFMYNEGSICGLKLTKAGGGFALRKVAGRRPHLHIPLDAVAVDGISDPEPDVLGGIEGTIADDGAVMFALPSVIEGSHKRHFTISRT